MFLLTLFTGILVCLTPIVFPYVFISSIVFGQTSSTKKQHFFNIFIFCIIVISIYLISGLYITDFNFINSVKTYEVLFTIVIKVSTILFSLWLIGLYKKNEIVNKLFSWFGLLLISLLITISSFGSTGPILGSLLANQGAENNLLAIAFLGFSEEIAFSFALVLLMSTTYYHKVVHKKWWDIIVKLTATLLIASSSIQLITL